VKSYNLITDGKSQTTSRNNIASLEKPLLNSRQIFLRYTTSAVLYSYQNTVFIFSAYNINIPAFCVNLNGDGINVDEEIKRIFRIAINRFYYSSAKHSLTMTYELMLKEYFNDGHRMVDGKKIPLLKSSSEIPTFGQFRYFFEKERNIKREVSTRYSPKKYEQEYRPVLGSSSTDAIGPGSVFQIDATVADVYLVSRFNRTHIIGRPVLYIVQDCFSKLIVGLYVGLEGPSWIGAAMALANTVGNKVSFLQSVWCRYSGRRVALYIISLRQFWQTEGKCCQTMQRV